jgi:uncharacterized protein (DUF433 family)
MQLEDYFDFLAGDDIRIKGHRVGIESVLYEYIHRARTPEQIAVRFPTLTLEQIYATILYYLHNMPEVRRYMEDWLAHGERMRTEQERSTPPQVARLREATARYTTHKSEGPEPRETSQ